MSALKTIHIAKSHGKPTTQTKICQKYVFANADGRKQPMGNSMYIIGREAVN
jgi:hypothetical protein